MKKFLFFAAFLVVGLSAKAQVKLSATGGFAYGLSSIETTYDNNEATAFDSGFYVGGAVQFKINDVVRIKTGLNYVNIDEANFIQLPAVAQFYIAGSGFYFQAGPQLTYTAEEISPEYTHINIGLGGGAGYEFGRFYAILANSYKFCRFSLILANFDEFLNNQF